MHPDRGAEAGEVGIFGRQAIKHGHDFVEACYRVLRRLGVVHQAFQLAAEHADAAVRAGCPAGSRAAASSSGAAA